MLELNYRSWKENGGKIGVICKAITVSGHGGP
jgi:hypothetical protein